MNKELIIDICFTLWQVILQTFVFSDKKAFQQKKKGLWRNTFLFIILSTLIVVLQTKHNVGLIGKNITLVILTIIYGITTFVYEFKHCVLLSIHYLVMIYFSEVVGISLSCMLFKADTNFMSSSSKLYYTALLLSQFILSFLIIALKRFYNTNLQKINTINWLTVFIPNLINCTFFMVASTYVYSSNHESPFFYYLFLFSILMMVSNYCCILMSQYFIKAKKIEQEIHLNLQQIQTQYLYYNSKLQDTERIRKLHHDMKNHLIVLNDSIESKEKKQYIEQLDEELKKFESHYNTGNKFLDVLLHSKYNEAQEHGIRMDIMVDLLGINQISNKDLCTLFGNAIDNAIEECQRISEAEEKNVLIKTKRLNGLLSLTFVNSIRKECIDNVNRNMKTSKNDKESHGFGLKNMQYVLNKYNGDLNIKVINGLYHLYMVIPIY